MRIDSQPVRAVDDVLSRAVALLDVVAEVGPTSTAADLARASGIPVSTTYRLLVRLELQGLVEHDERTGTYRLGTRIVRWGAAARLNLRVREEALPAMKALRDELGETVQLALRDGTEGFFVESVESSHPFRQHTQVGQRLPLHAGATMRLLLAYAPEEIVEEALQPDRLQALAPGTVTTGDLRGRLRAVREQQLAVSVSEIYADSVAVSAPVLDGTGELLAALTVSGPSSRMPAEHVHAEVVPALRRAARAVSARFGHAASQPDRGAES